MTARGPGSDETQMEGAARFARSIGEPFELIERLQRGVELVADLVPGCDHAGVTVITKTGVETDAASSDLVWRGDKLQYDLNEGPCLDSVSTQGTVISNDIVADRRWPRWGVAVAEQLGVRSMMSLLLYTDRGSIGALNMYALRTDAYDADDLSVAQALAAHLAVAAAAGREIEQRGNAMVGRTVIGQAEGILMERYQIDSDRAFDVLRRLSQDSNRKLTAIAHELVTTRQLPGASTDDAAPNAQGRTESA